MDLGRALGVAALLASSFAGHSAAGRNVALLVGVGQLRDPALQSMQLLGTAADIDAMQRALGDRWGFAPGDIVTLRDQDATRGHILGEIEALEGRSQRGDTLLIYFSGHGTSANADNNSFDLPYATGAWVPYDLDYSSMAAAKRTLIVGRSDLLPRLQHLDQSGRRVVVVSDSCYSGQVVRSFGQVRRSRFLPFTPRDLGISHAAQAASAIPAARPPPPPYPYQHVVLLSGASDSEQGADISTPQLLQQSPTLDGKYHGAFTDAFLRLLDGQLMPGVFTYAEGREAMNAFLEHRNFAQHPQLLPALAEDPQNIGADPFLGMHAAGHEAAAPVRDATVHLRLDAVSAALRSRVEHLGGVALVVQDNDLTLRERSGKAELLGPAGDPILETTAADPTLIRRIAAQAWLNRVLPASKGGLGLRTETSPGSRGNTFVQCESFAFDVRLEKPAYVMLLDLDPQGNFSVLYPTRPSEREIIAAGAVKAIPGGDPKDQIVVIPPFGTDQVAVLAFEKAPTIFAEFTGADRFAADGPRALALAQGLAAVSGVVDVQQINVHTYPGKTGGLCGS